MCSYMYVAIISVVIIVGDRGTHLRVAANRLCYRVYSILCIPPPQMSETIPELMRTVTSQHKVPALQQVLQATLGFLGSVLNGYNYSAGMMVEINL